MFVYNEWKDGKKSGDGECEGTMRAFSKCTSQNSGFKCPGLRTQKFLGTRRVMPEV
jgi:hypothetical protein